MTVVNLLQGGIASSNKFCINHNKTFKLRQFAEALKISN